MLWLLATSSFRRAQASGLTRAAPSPSYWLYGLSLDPVSSAAGYATGGDIKSQRLSDRWEVPAGSDLRISTRSPATVHVVFGEPDAVSVQVRQLSALTHITMSSKG